MCDGIVANQELLDRLRQIIVWPEQFPLFNFKCEIIVIDYSRVSGIRTSVLKMSEFAGNLRRKFNSFRHLGVESNPHRLPEERESANPQKVAERKEANTTEVNETSAPPAKNSSNLKDAPVRAECIGAELGNGDRILTVVDKDCVLTSSDDDVEDLSAFPAERQQCLSEGSAEKLIADESVNIEEILCGSVGIGKDGGGTRQSVCPSVTPGGFSALEGNAQRQADGRFAGF